LSDFLEVKIDKFTFRVATDRFYNSEGVWAKPESQFVRIGLSDSLQQRSGDIAFAEVKPEGTELAFGDEVAVIETIKVNISLNSPLSGRIIKVNPDMGMAPEVINQDPYNKGWIAIIEASDWGSDQSRLLTPAAYFAKMKADIEEELKKG